MEKLYYITRTYSPVETGIALTRTGVSGYLKQFGFDVIIVTPNYNKHDIEEKDNVIYYPFTFPVFTGLVLEKLGLFDDYMDLWVKGVYNYLKGKIRQNDIIYTTTGGELGCIKLGYLLKKAVGCRFVIHFHDPISHTYVNGLKISNVPHVRREPLENEYYQDADLLITTTEYYKKALINKYPYLEGRIFNNYFGYFREMDLPEPVKHDNLRIAYGGAMSKVQSPEILAKACSGLDGVEIYYIGRHDSYKPFNQFRGNCNFKNAMPHKQYLDFMTQNIDIGFVSLSIDYFGACIPAKLYEYINMGLPILGALPKGDAIDIINNNGYGIACKYDDTDGIKKAVEELRNPETRANFRSNILRDREQWSLKSSVDKIVALIKKNQEN